MLYKCLRKLCTFPFKSKYFMLLNSCVCSNGSNIYNKIIIEAKEVIHTILKYSFYLCVFR